MLERYGGKYANLLNVSTKTGIKIPTMIPLSIEDIKTLNKKSIEKKCWCLKFPVIIRSSSLLENNYTNGYELSWIYKSLISKTKDEIFEKINEIISYNLKSEHIQYIHRKYNYKYHPYIPLFIQELIEPDYSGVVLFQDSKIYIEYKKWFNFEITSWQNISNEKFSKLEIKLDEYKNYLSDRKINLILENILKIYQNLHEEFVVEFAVKNDNFFLLQYKKLWNVKYLKNHVKLYYDIFSFMRVLGYTPDEFMVEENETFLIFNELWVSQHISQKIEHIRIVLLNTKFDYFFVREWSDKFIYPKEKKIQNMLKDFYEKNWIELLFAINYDIFSSRRIPFFYNGINFYLYFYWEKYLWFDETFFKNRLNINNISIVEDAYIKKLTYLFEIVKSNKFSWKEKDFLKQKIKDILHKLKLISLFKKEVKNKILKANIFWKYLGDNSWVVIWTIFTDVKNIPSNFDWKVIFYCNDFEPARVAFLNKIDVILTKRWYKLSHGIALAKEFRKEILYDVKDINWLLIEGKKVKIDLATWIISLL